MHYNSMSSTQQGWRRQVMQHSVYPSNAGSRLQAQAPGSSVSSLSCPQHAIGFVHAEPQNPRSAGTPGDKLLSPLSWS